MLPGRGVRVAPGASGRWWTVLTTSRPIAPPYNAPTPCSGDLGVRGRQVGVGQPRPDDGQLTVREEQLAGRGELGEPGLVLARLLPESVIDDEPTAGDALGGAEIVSEAEAAIAAERPLPCHQRSGHPDRQSAADRRRERERLARGRIDEQVLGGAGGCGLTSVDRRDAAGAGVVIDEVAAPTDAGDVRLSDAERGGDSDCSVGGRPALAQDAEAGLGGIRTLGGDGAARANRDRVLGGRGRGRGCGDAGHGGGGARCGGRRDQCYERATKAHVVTMPRLQGVYAPARAVARLFGVGGVLRRRKERVERAQSGEYCP